MGEGKGDNTTCFTSRERLRREPGGRGEVEHCGDMGRKAGHAAACVTVSERGAAS